MPEEKKADGQDKTPASNDPQPPIDDKDKATVTTEKQRGKQSEETKIVTVKPVEIVIKEDKRSDAQIIWANTIATGSLVLALAVLYYTRELLLKTTISTDAAVRADSISIEALKLSTRQFDSTIASAKEQDKRADKEFNIRFTPYLQSYEFTIGSVNIGSFPMATGNIINIINNPVTIIGAESKIKLGGQNAYKWFDSLPYEPNQKVNITMNTLPSAVPFEIVLKDSLTILDYSQLKKNKIFFYVALKILYESPVLKTKFSKIEMFKVGVFPKVNVEFLKDTTVAL